MPGFFKLRDRRRNRRNKCVKRRKVSPKDFHEDTEIVPKYRNCLKFLNHREIGATAGVQAEKEYYQMKTSHKEKASSSKLSMPFIYDSCEVIFFNGDDESVVGLWQLQDKKCRNKRYVLGEFVYNMNNESYHLIRQPYMYIQDMCPASTKFIIVDNPEPHSAHIGFVGESIFPWYTCCCYIPRSNSAVFGGDRHILIIKGWEGSEHELERTTTKFDAQICTASYNPESSTMLLGLNKGELCIIDYRTLDSEVLRKEPFYIKISDNAVNDSLFLNDKEVIVTDIAGRLVKVDLRARKISATFFEHKHSVYKRPFSVANNMLCATGADNVVRIWHTSGGNPIHVHKSTSGHEVRGWLNSDGNKTYLNYFERDTRTVFTF